MNDREVIAFLKTQTAEPPSADAVDRCISALPEVRRRKGIAPLIRLQLISLPLSMYLFALLLMYAEWRLMNSMQPDAALVWSGIVSAIIALLFAWHLTLSFAGSMAEIEGCCKYSYGQILLSRVLCLCGLTLAALLAAAIPSAVQQDMGIGYILMVLLPTTLGALNAVVWANYRGNGDAALMAVYLVTALLVSLNLERLLSLGTLAAAILLAAILTALVAQTKSLMNRRTRNEAYPI